MGVVEQEGSGLRLKVFHFVFHLKKGGCRHAFDDIARQDLFMLIDTLALTSF